MTLVGVLCKQNVKVIDTGKQLLSHTYSPEQYPQNIGHQEDQTHVDGEALGVLRPADVSVLGDVRHHPSEHHGTRGDPRHQPVEHIHHLLEHLIFQFHGDLSCLSFWLERKMKLVSCLDTG